MGLAREDFVEAAKALQAQLTDEAIEAAARRMPPEWYAIDGARLVSDLKARRDGLPEVAEKYYEHLAERVDVYLTDRSERIDAAARPTATWRSASARSRARSQPGAPTFHRVFDGKETDEVRFYTLGGNDSMSVSGGKQGPAACA